MSEKDEKIREAGMWTDGKMHATVTDSSKADNIPCFGNCKRPPDNKAEEEWENYCIWDRTYATFPNDI